ncbi:DUF6371 domain-containing protein [Dyadobacter tibetensis]|uniref:DUF6371 domain-containing protein n=1 Tax=Dyadobacter tibetensis TaxID=1211851 RepID=UPI00046F7DFC|nr:DUF6371 domain-containing protein [Dyadobacter tibetensis]
MVEKQIFASCEERRRVKLCPCGESNQSLKFANFKGQDKYGYCHSCDRTFYPSDLNKNINNKVSVSCIPKLTGNRKPETILPVTIIPNELVKENVTSSQGVRLLEWLSDQKRRGKGEVPFNIEQVRAIVKRYRIRGTDRYNGGVAFIYIDLNENVRQIKLMDYCRNTGKRVKEPGRIMQVGKELAKKSGIEQINIVACFFGEHLLRGNKKDVYIFESEATAIYASVFYPNCVCLATGGKNGCKWGEYDQYKVLMGRKVTLWPDIDAHDEWVSRAEALKMAGLNVHVKDVIVKSAQEQAKILDIEYEVFQNQKYDLRDLLIYKDPHNIRIKQKIEIIKSTVIHPQPQQVESVFDSLDFLNSDTFDHSQPTSKAFNTEEYRLWFDSINKPESPIYIEGDLTVYNVSDFVHGCLNHIDAFTNYREPGNKIQFIRQLERLRTILSTGK